MYLYLYGLEKQWALQPYDVKNLRPVVGTRRLEGTLKHTHIFPNRWNKVSKQCQHPTEDTHIHAVEQVRPQGIKKNSGQNNEIVTTTKSAGKLYPTVRCNNPESDTG